MESLCQSTSDLAKCLGQISRFSSSLDTEDCRQAADQEEKHILACIAEGSIWGG